MGYKHFNLLREKKNTGLKAKYVYIQKKSTENTKYKTS